MYYLSTEILRRIIKLNIVKFQNISGDSLKNRVTQYIRPCKFAFLIIIMAISLELKSFANFLKFRYLNRTIYTTDLLQLFNSECSITVHYKRTFRLWLVDHISCISLK